ncbi:ABC transporter ATP-binding protein [Marmoricola sp. RAF53]|uniref:ABC transporter ATP-binding protein n=1 Tax=Marmoricola sp. RAF53 TaxID=3233059 RepID=UPI003F9D5ABF
MTNPSHGASVTLTGLTKRYGDSVALNNVSLDIAPGEFMTLLGPSGSGKTTTLNSIAGFVTPDQGGITIAGHPVSALPPHKRNIGMVFQNYALFPHMTVNANVAFPLKQRKWSRDKITRAVAEVLELVGLGHLGGRYPRQLSGGQQQRVALARALVYQPEVLLLDEPLGALDKRLREGLQLEIMRIHKEVGVTLVFVTHDQDEALMMSDRIAVFRDGGIEQVGTAEDLYQQPSSRFVAEFLGDSNLFEGPLMRNGSNATLSSDGYDLQLGEQTVDERGQVALMVRPECMHLRRPEDGAPGNAANVIRGRVAQVIYMGSRRRVHVQVPGRERVVLVDSQVTDESNVADGDDLLVCWQPAHGVLVGAGERA